jgi:hypothetical protein
VRRILPAFPAARALAVLATAVTASTLLTVPAQDAEATGLARAAEGRRITYTSWDRPVELLRGHFNGTRLKHGRLRLSAHTKVRRYDDPHGYRTKRYRYGRWLSPWQRSRFGLTELIASWEATARKDSWVQIQVRGRTATGQRAGWDTLARWTPRDGRFHRTSDGPQTDDIASVATDTWRSDSDAGFTRWQLRVTLYGRAGTNATPFVDTVGAMASRLPDVSAVLRSRPGVARGITLNVPRYSQMIHTGDFARWGGGGEAWCSPTSTSMVLGFYGRLPRPASYAWVDKPHRNAWVDYAARMTYDYRYDGTGNWPFNTAYAARFTGHAFVTRLRSLRQAERFIKVGIPVVASIAFGPGELDGAPISATNGHLVVIVGFRKNGDPVVNDPAARHNPGVRRVYDRGQFENAWLPGSGGLAYIIRTDQQELPPRHRARNW